MESANSVLFNDLGLIPRNVNVKTSNNKNRNDTNGDVDPLNLLDELLRSKAVTPAAVRNAHKAVLQRANSSTISVNTKQPAQAQPSATHRTRHVAMRLYYDGAPYTGLAQNMGHDDDRSVERALFAALSKTRLVGDRASSGYSRCGRTDKGVSAAGQVVAFRNLKSNVPLDATWDEQGTQPVTNAQLPNNNTESILVWMLPKKKSTSEAVTSIRLQKHIWELPYAKMLNNVLPPDIQIFGWCPVSDDFSARFSANARTYRYFFVRRQLDLHRMRQALQLMIGTHDFRNFCKMDVEKVYNFERTIREATIVEPLALASSSTKTRSCSDVCYFDIHGQAFLWHQIRCIVSILFMVGQGLEQPSIVKELLDVSTHPGKPSYSLAAEQPLVLHDCGYPNLRMGHTAQNLFALTCRLEQKWEELTLAAARVQNGLNRLKGASLLRKDVLELVSRKLEDRSKKQGKHRNLSLMPDTPVRSEQLDEGLPSGLVLTWGDAVEWMSTKDCRPDPQSRKDVVHVPLLDRSRGTTYEQKIEALNSGSDKRRLKYEENVIKKRKTTEEDSAFYDHMMKQGGSGI